MLTQKLLHSSNMLHMLVVVVRYFEDMGVICEITSPTTISFSSTLPKACVREVFEGSSVPFTPSFEDVEQGARGSAEVQAIPRADE